MILSVMAATMFLGASVWAIGREPTRAMIAVHRGYSINPRQIDFANAGRIHVLINPGEIAPGGLTPAQISSLQAQMAQAYRERPAIFASRPSLLRRFLAEGNYPGYPGPGGSWQSSGGRAVYVLNGRSYAPTISQFGEIFFLEQSAPPRRVRGR